ncbi:hypothetical protein [Streptomyces sp. NPDC093984]|uniref:hypothetical protein n=1 Tax=Streptomyces sp. NPDC093984 TaxID=3366052 RepID=UPI003810FB0F
MTCSGRRDSTIDSPSGPSNSNVAATPSGGWPMAWKYARFMAASTSPRETAARHCRAVTCRSRGRTNSHRNAGEKTIRIPANAVGPAVAYASSARAEPTCRLKIWPSIRAVPLRHPVDPGGDSSPWAPPASFGLRVAPPTVL